MNYYPFHIGDFRSGTVNMSRLTRWIYRDMLDVYYDSEKPLPLDMDVLCHVIGADNPDERQIVERLLRFKFQKTDVGYTQITCERVIAEYRQKGDTARANGKLGGRPRSRKENQDKPTGFGLGSNPVAISKQQQTGSEANQEPVTKNQEPNIKAEASQRGSRLPADWVPSEEEILFCKTERPDLNAEVVAHCFRDFWVAKPGKDGRKTDWPATWRNWVRNEKIRGKSTTLSTGVWWATDASILAKGLDISPPLKPLAGESMQAFKGRVQAAIDNGGKQPAQKPGPVLVVKDDEPRGVMPHGLNLRSLINPGTRQ